MYEQNLLDSRESIANTLDPPCHPPPPYSALNSTRVRKMDTITVVSANKM